MTISFTHARDTIPMTRTTTMPRDTLAGLMPLPQSYATHGDARRTPRVWRVFVPAGARVPNAILREELPAYRLVATPAEADLVLLSESVADLPPGLKPWQVKESYGLSCTATQVLVRSTFDRGRNHALRTLGQLLVLGNGRLGQVEITDWPALPFRGAHLTLGSGHQPTFPRLKAFITDLARLKISSLTIEYDDGFRWEKYPFIARAGSLSKDEVRELISYAGERQVDLIPLVDSLGHQEHYLCHPQLAHLRELPGHSAELCASNPAGLSFIKDLWQEVLEVHGPGTWANITGDEVFRLGGFCPRCAPHAQGGPPAQLYGDWYADLSRWMLEQGRRPMLWHDMLVQFPEQLARLPREAGLIYWNYKAIDASRWTAGHGLHGTIFPEDLAHQSPTARARFEDYWRHPEDSSSFRPWPYLPWLVDQGFTTFAASAGSPVESPNPCMGFAGRVDNAKSLARATQACGAEGLLHTFWSTYATPLAAWHATAAAGDHAWHPRIEAADSVIERWGRLRHGGDRSYANFASACDRAFYPRHPLGFAPPKSAEQQLAGVRRRATALRPERHADELAPHRAAITFAEIKLRRAHAASTQLARCLGAGEDQAISLAPVANATRLAFSPGADGCRLDLPVGRHRSHGVLMEIPPSGPRDCLTLRSRRNPAGPERAVIPIGSNFDSIFIWSSVYYIGREATAATVRVRYVDGRVDEQVLVVGRDVGDWFDGPDALDRGLVGWNGYVSPHGQIPARVYLAWHHTSQPRTRITEVEFVAAGGDGHLILLAMTGRTQRHGRPPEPVSMGCVGARARRRFAREYRHALAGMTVPVHLPLAERALKM